MKVYVEPIPATLSRAMHRVASALRQHAPASVELVYEPRQADLQVMHIVCMTSAEALQAPRGVAIQYVFECGHTPAEVVPDWVATTWRKMDLVWSYYDLAPYLPDGVKFFHSPLGIDANFVSAAPNGIPRQHGVLTSGFVHGHGAEAIEEPALAAQRCGLSTVHLGPKPKQMLQFPPRWKAIHNVSDATLAAYYRRTLWVSGLRHVEGFEFPVVEGLACGCRPIVFDRPETRRWFEGHVEFVQEAEGDRLVDVLTSIFANAPEPVTPEERDVVLEKFSWATIARNFWTAVGAE